MSISSSTVIEIRTTGSDTNGGGFVTGASGTDWSQQAAAQYSVTDGVTAGTTTITSATANFGTDVVGNLIYVQGGTGSVVAGWYQIISRTNATTIVVDRTTGLTAGTGVTLKIGGALLSPGQMSALIISGGSPSNLTAWLKAGNYSIGSGTVNTSGNGCAPNFTNLAMRGYDATRGDNTGTRPVLLATTSGQTLIDSATGVGSVLVNIKADANGQTTITGLRCSRGRIVNCLVTGCATGYLTVADMSTAVSCTVGFNLGGSMSIATSCTTGFTAGACAFSLATACTTGFLQVTAGTMPILNCVAYGGTTGFNVTTDNKGIFANNIAYSNSGKGYSGSMMSTTTFSNAAGANTSGNDFTLNVTLTADPFTNAAGGDFSLNNAAGGGALCRAAGVPGLLQNGTTMGYIDIGVAQHQDSGGASQTSFTF